MGAECDAEKILEIIASLESVTSLPWERDPKEMVELTTKVGEVLLSGGYLFDPKKMDELKEAIMSAEGYDKMTKDIAAQVVETAKQASKRFILGEGQPKVEVVDE
jgi:hypothetical protein